MTESRLPLPWQVIEFPSPESMQLRLLMRRVAVFEHLDDGEVDWLLQRIEKRAFAAGEMLMAEGEPGDAMYVIASGTVGVFKKRWFRRRRIASRSRDEWVGEMALLDGAPRYATVVWDDPGEAYRLPRSAFQEVLLRNPGAAALLRESAEYRKTQDRAAGIF